MERTMSENEQQCFEHTPPAVILKSEAMKDIGTAL
jgi:hypothetical protein